MSTRTIAAPLGCRTVSTWSLSLSDRRSCQTLSLLPVASYEVIPRKGRMGINYGLNRVRFPAPVPVGSRVRASFEVVGVDEFDGGAQVTMSATVEREGSEKPVCVAEVVFRYYE